MQIIYNRGIRNLTYRDWNIRTFNNFNGVYVCKTEQKSKGKKQKRQRGSVFHFLNAWSRLVKEKSNLDCVDLTICILALYPGN